MDAKYDIVDGSPDEVMLLVCDWLHSIGQNQFHVMLLFLSGMLFLLRVYMSVMCFKKILCGFQDKEVESLSSVRTSLSIVQTLFIQATSVRMMWLFRPDSH
jgi:hypothetical protein